MKRALLAVFLAAGLPGCTVVPKRVLVPVPQPCTVEKPAEPVWATRALKDDAGIWDQVRVLLAERRQRIGYETALVAALKTCTDPVEAAPLTPQAAGLVPAPGSPAAK